MSRLRRPGVLLGALLLLPLRPALGQSILVQVVEAETGDPIPTAFVTLTDESGATLKGALTNPDGQALIPLPSSGDYRIRVQMFGRETTWSPPLQVRVGESLMRRFELPLEAIALPEIRVEGERQCRIHPQDGQELARVWEEASKALSIQSWTGEGSGYEFRVLSYKREMDPRGLHVLSEEQNAMVTRAQNPIRSLTPTDLLREGFVRIRRDGSWDFFGPDARVLLSDEFLNTHCFRLRESGDLPGWIGLGFEPVREEEIPDIAGTFWVDRATSHLGFLEFEYVDVPNPLNRRRSEGRVDFERLPNGAWIVRSWWIRTPLMGRAADDDRWWVTGVQMTGGDVVEIQAIREGGG